MQIRDADFLSLICAGAAIGNILTAVFTKEPMAWGFSVIWAIVGYGIQVYVAVKDKED